MAYRLTALMFLVLGMSLGISVILASGANTAVKQILGFLVPTLAGLGFALAWWRKARL